VEELAVRAKQTLVALELMELQTLVVEVVVLVRAKAQSLSLLVMVVLD
jgi:hypothetical protein